MISSASRRGFRGATRSLVRRSSRLSRQLVVLRHHLPPSGRSIAYYTTERILQIRSGNDKLKTLYDANRETENCGVGLVASLKSVASRKVVEDADEMLVRMAHRGGCGCDPASGDGAGK
jgi:hypothetical protein